MIRIYLDYNGFQRGFDDPQHVRIQMEALACQEIFNRAAHGEVELVWSFMHQDESLQCPFPDRQLEAFRLASLCRVRIGPEEAIYNLAQSYIQQGAVSAKDAIHLACAIHTGAEVFLTWDDKLLKQAARLGLTMRVLNPVDFIRQRGE
ncbi:MAG TPA: PIN domain-containing protein [Blastocatellia bacterium]|nr:PIN domain-containing protein [Blastocatellia bacterium]